jgi:PIN domain nuclease of toxin-antitoxin system
VEYVSQGVFLVAAVLDTHAAVWYLLRSPSLSPKALQAIEVAFQSGEPVFLPSISLVEVIYLVEKGRLPMPALERLMAAFENPSAALRIAPLDIDVTKSVQQISRDTVPDMPDRIIAATALRLGLPLVTRDQRMKATGIEVIW